MKKSRIISFIILVLVLVLIVITVLKMKNPNFKIIKKDTKNIELICNRNTIDLYKIKYNIKYINNNVNKVTVTFKSINTKRNSDNYSETNNLILDYIMLNDSKYRYVNNDLIITIDKNIYNKNKDRKFLKNLFASYDDVRKYLEDLDYICK